MRVLWLTNIPLPALSGILGRAPEVMGGWMAALLDELRKCADLEIAVATGLPGQRTMTRHAADGVTYYCLPAMALRAGELTPDVRKACEAVLSEFRPELIHVHGTEQLYGLFTATRPPRPSAVISIQGLIHVYAKHVTGGLRFCDASEAGLPGILSWLRSKVMEHSWSRRGVTERRILAGNRDFIGRTDWDKAHVLANNPRATYLHCGELLRKPFHQRTWDPKTATRRSIFCTAAGAPHKGFHLVLDALTLLREEFPEITVRVAGAPWDTDRGFGYYGRYLKAMIDRRGLSRHVTPLPSLRAEQVADELAAASAFVIPSFIENSPNSLGEAMLVGTPCVAALAGGIPSLIDDGATALGFPVGDAACLAHCLRRIFTDGSLSQRLSSSAREVALRRYDPATVVADQLEIYRRIISGHAN